MPVYSKKLLSSSAEGLSVMVAATSSPGTVVHTGSSSASVMQEVWIYAMNTDVSTRTLTLQWGGTTSPDNSITLQVSPSSSGPVLVIPGFLLKGNSTPNVIRAFSDSANRIAIYGYVNEIA